MTKTEILQQMNDTVSKLQRAVSGKIEKKEDAEYIVSILERSSSQLQREIRDYTATEENEERDMWEDLSDHITMESVLAEESGFWSNDACQFNINYSSILTSLIQADGRICKHHASDLFILWNSLEKEIKNREYAGGKYLFGFRVNGVDSNTHILYRLNAYGVEAAQKEIKELYLLDIQVENDEMKMSLGKAVLAGA